MGTPIRWLNHKRMLNTILKIIILSLPLFIIGSCIHSVRFEVQEVRVDTIRIVDTVIQRDTIYIEEKNKYFHSFDDVILFVAYLKTQSGRLDDDNWTVIHTLFNRMNKHKVGWREYFNTPSINNSRTIRRMIKGSVKSYVDLQDEVDLRMIQRVLNAYFGFNPTNCPPDVLYFESFKHSPNRGVFLKSNLWKEYRHKFYYGNGENQLQTANRTSTRNS